MKVIKELAPLSPQQNEALLAMLPAHVNPEKIVFWDIETTGFSRRYDSIYLMGYFYWEGRTPYLEQHLCSSTAEEIGLLENFLQKMDDFEVLVSFNGDTFDIPFVQERLKQMRVRGHLSEFRSMDLYKMYRPYASFFGWTNCKLKSIECFLNLERRDTMDGGELIEVFYEYSRTDDPGLQKTLLLHNYEDILNLPYLLKIQHYMDFLKSAAVTGLQVRPQGQKMILDFTLSQNPPLSIQGQFLIHKKSVPVDLRTDCQKPHIELSVPIRTDTLRYYLPNYKEYYVLPSGQLMHKSLGTPPQKKAATKADCFLPRTGTFLPAAGELEGLHPFRTDSRDKSIYLEIEELQRWLPQQEEAALQQFLQQYLPF